MNVGDRSASKEHMTGVYYPERPNVRTILNSLKHILLDRILFIFIICPIYH